MSDHRIPQHLEDEDSDGCTCLDGWHYIGCMVEDPENLDGESLEQVRVPCRRCQRAEEMTWPPESGKQIMDEEDE